MTNESVSCYVNEKLLKYKSEGVIKPPVRAWVDVYEAIRFKRTFRNTRGRCEMVDRYINVERYFEYLDNMESYFADIHTDITKMYQLEHRREKPKISIGWRVKYWQNISC